MTFPRDIADDTAEGWGLGAQRFYTSPPKCNRSRPAIRGPEGTSDWSPAQLTILKRTGSCVLFADPKEKTP